jgi:hypothetical protein
MPGIGCRERLPVQPVHQRGGVKILDGRTGSSKGSVGILLCLKARHPLLTTGLTRAAPARLPQQALPPR